MSRRSPPQKNIDEQSWPIRLIFKVPERGFGARFDEFNQWLRTEVGQKEHASHTGPRNPHCDTIAIYLRDFSVAAKLIETFPDFEFFDGTNSPDYTSPHLPFGR